MVIFNASWIMVTGHHLLYLPATWLAGSNDHKRKGTVTFIFCYHCSATGGGTVSSGSTSNTGGSTRGRDETAELADLLLQLQDEFGRLSLWVQYILYLRAMCIVRACLHWASEKILRLQIYLGLQPIFEQLALSNLIRVVSLVKWQHWHWCSV